MSSLILECICSPDASICVLTQAVYNVESSVFQLGTIGAEVILTLSDSDGGFVTLFEPHGKYSIDLLPLSRVVENFGSLVVTLFMDASLFQKPDPPYSQYQTWDILRWITLIYQCTNLVTGSVTHLSVISTPINSGGYVECKTGEIIRGFVNGSFNAAFYYSSPLGACFSGGISSFDDDFEPSPDGGMMNIDDSGQICLCATGGSGNYTYSIIDGSLPCGVTLNQQTGCLEGESDGTCPGTKNVTFRVTDAGAGGETSTGGVTIGGTCRTFGTGVTRISGGAWTSDMAGNSISIGGGTFTVSTVSGSDNMTLSASAGIADPTSWSYTSPVVAPPPPGPPETAEVTCGFVGKCPNSDTGLGGNSAY